MILRSSRFSDRKFYGCERYPECEGTIGAHSDGTPLGIPGSIEDKAARQRAHAALDPIWQDCMKEYGDPGQRSEEELRRIARGRAYRWLAAELGGLTPAECHIGNFDAERCEQVVRICQGATYAEIRAWCKANPRGK